MNTLQVVDIPVANPGRMEFSYDPEWLAILRETHSMMNLTRRPTRFPTPLAEAPPVAADHLVHVTTQLSQRGSAAVALDFKATVDVGLRGQGTPPTSIPRNHQTEARALPFQYQCVFSCI